MRTDAKIGFAIGGVLLAVLTVYVIVAQRHPKKTTGVVSLVTPPVVTPGVTAPTPSSPSDTVVPTPPIAAADSPSTTSSKDAGGMVAPVPPIPSSNGPIVDNITVPDNGFHPITIPNDAGKASNKPSKLGDGGVYIPDGVVPVKPHKTGRTISPLPNDTADTSNAADRVYVIKSGQTLSKIAYEVYGNSRFWVAIQRENKGLDSNHLKVGSKINLPDISPLPGPVTVGEVEVAPSVAPSVAPTHHGAAVSADAHSYTVQSGDTLYGIAKRLFGSGRKADSLYVLNKDLIGPDKSRLKLGMVLKLPQVGTTALAVNHSVR